jgi:hypothetical protein
MSAATTRRTPDGHVLGPTEQLESHAALDANLAPPYDPSGPPRHVQAGVPADLVLLDSEQHVKATLIDGRVVT